MHRPALLRRADRLRRDDGERLPGAGQIADRIERGLIDGTLTDAMRRYRDAIDQGLLKIMSKMGISVISSYRGGLNFEAVGLSRAMVAEYFPGMHSRISGIGWRASRPRPRGPRQGLAGRRGRPAHRRLLQGAALGREARLGGADDAPAAGRPATGRAYDLWKQYSTAMRRTRRSTCATCWTSSRWASRCRSRRWKASPRSASGS
jgi:glutamate synthase (NADPH) large chain